MFVCVGASPAHCALYRSVLPPSAVIVASSSDVIGADVAIGCVLLRCAGLERGCEPLPIESSYPSVRICAHGIGHGEFVLREDEVPGRLGRVAVAARAAWHWKVLLARLDSASAVRRFLEELPVAHVGVGDVGTLASSCGLPRSTLAARWGRVQPLTGMGSLKQLIDWLTMLRIVSARHEGATGEEASHLCGISPRTYWRLVRRMAAAGVTPEMPIEMVVAKCAARLTEGGSS